ncbi:DUF5329 family protein [Leptospira sp. GIMC2001]|uniref:DUF5329 family protein n=1 Tax=Leptospira sp. GIMC2001 TaxID=1513297 RepID=UPI002348EFF3|nr:DUF5329 family protein [Leptospira sp. GIMC2001]WCL47656.1 DUF5329 family protein [Leptospira sp. GIMC2001]
MNSIRSLKLWIVSALLVMIPILGYNSYAQVQSEFDQDLQTLLNNLENCNCIYIRNGSEYTALQARQHMELKMKSSRGMISTIPNFIKHIATKSSMTGIPYLIKFKDGKTIESSVWLTDQWEILKKSKLNNQ